MEELKCSKKAASRLTPLKGSTLMNLSTTYRGNSILSLMNRKKEKIHLMQ
jgi:hypothetical protein